MKVHQKVMCFTHKNLSQTDQFNSMLEKIRKYCLNIYEYITETGNYATNDFQHETCEGCSFLAKRSSFSDLIIFRRTQSE